MLTDARILEDVMRREGWPRYTNDPDDAGGPTKGGITLGTLSRWRKGPVTAGDLMILTDTEALAIYRSLYLVGPNFDKLEDAWLREALVDSGVLHGPERAIRWLQESCNAERDAIGWERIPHIPQLAIDGVLGPKSLAAANRLPGERIRQRVIAKRIRWTGRRIQSGKNVKYAAGWLSRIAGLIESPLNLGDLE